LKLLVGVGEDRAVGKASLEAGSSLAGGTGVRLGGSWREDVLQDGIDQVVDVAAVGVGYDTGWKQLFT
jgi:hypothetical protein